MANQSKKKEPKEKIKILRDFNEVRVIEHCDDRPFLVSIITAQALEGHYLIFAKRYHTCLLEDYENVGRAMPIGIADRGKPRELYRKMQTYARQDAKKVE